MAASARIYEKSKPNVKLIIASEKRITWVRPYSKCVFSSVGKACAKYPSKRCLLRSAVTPLNLAINKNTVSNLLRREEKMGSEIYSEQEAPFSWWGKPFINEFTATLRNIILVLGSYRRLWTIQEHWWG